MKLLWNKIRIENHSKFHIFSNVLNLDLPFLVLGFDIFLKKNFPKLNQMWRNNSNNNNMAIYLVDSMVTFSH